MKKLGLKTTPEKKKRSGKREKKEMKKKRKKERKKEREKERKRETKREGIRSDRRKFNNEAAQPIISVVHPRRPGRGSVSLVPAPRHSIFLSVKRYQANCICPLHRGSEPDQTVFVPGYYSSLAGGGSQGALSRAFVSGSRASIECLFRRWIGRSGARNKFKDRINFIS